MKIRIPKNLILINFDPFQLGCGNYLELDARLARYAETDQPSDKCESRLSEYQNKEFHA